jgi:hypothetical protein
MSEPRTIATTVHDMIDDVSTAVEDIHRAVAEYPLTVLGEITPFKETLDDVKTTQDQTIEAVYGLVRSINAQARRITCYGAGENSANVRDGGIRSTFAKTPLVAPIGP